MSVSKEIAEKVKKYEMLQQEANKLYEEIEDAFRAEELMGEESSFITNFGIANEVPCIAKGPNENGEYDCVTSTFEDSCWGNYYFPIENSDEFVCISYST